MKAIVIEKPGGPEVLQLKEYPTPKPDPLEVLIEVKAAGLNRADLLQREGKYPPPPGVPQDIPGLEISGIVTACGTDVTMWKPGDKVCALIAAGGYAQYAVTKEGQCMPIPENLDFVQAAALPEAVATVWSNVFQRGQLKAGEHLLIHGGNSGIGTAAIQLGKAFGATVSVTVSSAEKAEACLQLGADTAINYKTQEFDQVLASQGVDVILDMVGGDYFTKNMRILKEEGRIVYINSAAGNVVPLNLHQMMVRRITLTGSTIRVRDYAWRKALSAELQQKVWPLITSGRYKPVIHRTFHYTETAKAHAFMETSQHTGKIMLSWE